MTVMAFQAIFGILASIIVMGFHATANIGLIVEGQISPVGKK